MSGYSIIDADTHITEPPDLWTSRAPSAMRDKVPRIETDSQGDMKWWFGDRPSLISPGISATAGVGNFKNPPKTFEQMHPGAFNAHARLKYMDQMGIWAMVLYPNVGGFGAQAFRNLGDPKLMLACVQMYNDWQSDWAAADSRRLLPVTSLPFWDIDAAVKEVHRCAKKGHKAILFTGEPQSLGLPLLGDKHWEPLWNAAVECDLSLSFHIGSGDMEDGMRDAKVATYGRSAAFTDLGVSFFLRNGLQLNDLLMSGVLVRHPKIKFVSVESGIGWVPFILEALDYQFKGNTVRDERPEFTMLPSEYFRRNVYACYWFEQTAPQRLIDEVGEDNVLFETDFPHPTSLFGSEVNERIETGLSRVDATVRRKILWENGRKLYKVDPPTAADEKKRETQLTAA